MDPSNRKQPTIVPAPAWRAAHTVVSLGLTALALSVPTHAQDPPNIVLIVADDLGIEYLDAYGFGTGPEAATTPTLDAMAAEGRLFRSAWSNPVCSPTRATIQTGLYGFQNGVGNVVNDRDFPFPAFYVDDLSVADVLKSETDYATGAFGKWHLGMSNDPTVGGSANPNLQGYDQFTGTRANLDADELGYSGFQWIENGNCDPILPPEARDACPIETTYATTQVTDWTLDWLDTLGSPAEAPPWLAYVAYHAPHTPLHFPPAELTTIPACPTIGGAFCCNQGNADATPVACYLAMVEALDFEVGRLIDGVDARGFGDDTVVIFVGDNGTRNETLGAPYPAGHGKGSLYNGGVLVPLLMTGPGITAGEVAGLVNTSDLFATVLELAEVSPEVFEQRRPFSISTVPYLADPQPAESLRPIQFAELFEAQRTNPPQPVAGEPPYLRQNLAIADARFKLVQRGIVGSPIRQELYDLVADPIEAVDLLEGPITLEISEALQALRDRLAQLTGCEEPRLLDHDCLIPAP